MLPSKVREERLAHLESGSVNRIVKKKNGSVRSDAKKKSGCENNANEKKQSPRKNVRRLFGKNKMSKISYRQGRMHMHGVANVVPSYVNLY